MLQLAEPGAATTTGTSRPPHPVCIPARRFNNRADCSNERTSFNGAWSLPSLAETKVRPQPSGHPLTESARQCPAASTHSAGSSEQITVLTSSIDALTPRPPKRSIPPVTKRPLIWNTPATNYRSPITTTCPPRSRPSTAAALIFVFAIPVWCHKSAPVESRFRPSTSTPCRFIETARVRRRQAISGRPCWRRSAG